MARRLSDLKEGEYFSLATSENELMFLEKTAVGTDIFYRYQEVGGKTVATKNNYFIMD